VVTSETVQEGCAGVDQVIRNALGVELGEQVVVSPVRDSPHGPADWLFGRPRYIVCRVQVADLVTIEQDVALLTPLVLDLLGVASGSRVYIEGHAEAGREPPRLSARAHALPDPMAAARTEISGGGLDARYPSALTRWGSDPTCPGCSWTPRCVVVRGLGHHNLAVVRIRANPWTSSATSSARCSCCSSWRPSAWCPSCPTHGSRGGSSWRCSWWGPP
jgi:hypothetical protein